MRRRAFIPAAACLLLTVTVGCQREEAPPEPGVADAEAAVPPTALSVRMDENLLADQRAISRTADKQLAAAAPALTAVEVEGPKPAAPAPAAEAAPAPAETAATPPEAGEQPGETPSAAERPAASGGWLNTIKAAMTGGPRAAAPPTPASAPAEEPAEEPAAPAPPAVAEAPAEEPGPAAETEPAGTGDPIQDVRQVLAKMVALPKSGPMRMAKEEDFANFLVEADATTAQALVEANKTAQQKRETLMDVMQTKSLARRAPRQLQAQLGGQGMDPMMMMMMGGGGLPGSELTQMTANMLTVNLVGGKVNVTSPRRQVYTFVKVRGAWKLQYDANQKKSLKAMEGYAQAQVLFLDAVIGGMNDGSITSDNLDAKVQELDKRLIQPAMQELRMTMSQPGMMGPPGMMPPGGMPPGMMPPGGMPPGMMPPGGQRQGPVPPARPPTPRR